MKSSELYPGGTEVLFSEKLALVVGPHPYAWAARHDIPKGTMRSYLSTENPQRKSLARLVAASGIPLEWWINGEGPPPMASDEPEKIIEVAVDPGPMVVEERRHSYPDKAAAAVGRINVKALAAILEGALKTAPYAAPHAIAEHCAKIYAQAIEDGLITPDGLGPGKVDKAA